VILIKTVEAGKARPRYSTILIWLLLFSSLLFRKRVVRCLHCHLFTRPRCSCSSKYSSPYQQMIGPNMYLLGSRWVNWSQSWPPSFGEPLSILPT